MNPLHKIMIVGSAFGLGHHLAEMFPDHQQEPKRELTSADEKAIEDARAKRERRANKLRARGDA